MLKHVRTRTIAAATSLTLALSTAPAHAGDLCRGAPQNTAAQETAECSKVIADPGESKERKAGAYLNRGRIEALAAQFDRAISDFDRAIALKPDDATVYLERC